MNLERYQKLEEIMNSGMYYVDSDLGEVWSNYGKGQWLKPSTTSNGYQQVGLFLENRDYKYKLHELVAYAAYGNKLIGMTVNHIDGNKRNNGAHNLNVATMSEQISHAYKTGLRQTKLTDQKVQEMKQLYTTGEYTLIEIAKMFNVCRSTVISIIKGRTWCYATSLTTV